MEVFNLEIAEGLKAAALLDSTRNPESLHIATLPGEPDVIVGNRELEAPARDIGDTLLRETLCGSFGDIADRNILRATPGSSGLVEVLTIEGDHSWLMRVFSSARRYTLGRDVSGLVVASFRPRSGNSRVSAASPSDISEIRGIISRS
jgi:hypothetical protein